jgi:hypothetical protein
VEASSKIGSYEGEMLNRDLTNLRAGRHLTALWARTIAIWHLPLILR